MPPLISVIMPAYNAATYLDEAIASVLAQTYREIELIVVDDGSTDDTAQLAKRYCSVRYQYQEHAGAAAARNTGVQLAHGQLLAFLDADDLWIENKLSLQEEFLEKHREIDLIFGRLEEFLCGALKDSAVEARHKPGFVFGTMLIGTPTFRLVGILESGMGEFIDWFARARDAGLKYEMLPEVLLRRRIHGANTTLQQGKSSSDYVKIAHKLILRTRNAPPDPDAEPGS